MGHSLATRSTMATAVATDLQSLLWQLDMEPECWCHGHISICGAVVCQITVNADAWFDPYDWELSVFGRGGTNVLKVGWLYCEWMVAVGSGRTLSAEVTA